MHKIGFLRDRTKYILRSKLTTVMNRACPKRLLPRNASTTSISCRSIGSTKIALTRNMGNNMFLAFDAWSLVLRNSRERSCNICFRIKIQVRALISDFGIYTSRFFFSIAGFLVILYEYFRLLLLLHHQAVYGSVEGEI